MMENQDKILKLLIEKFSSPETNLKCPMCGNEHFKFMREGYNILPLSDTATKPTPNMRLIPTVMMVCDNCGFISQHSEKVLVDPPAKR